MVMAPKILVKQDVQSETPKVVEPLLKDIFKIFKSRISRIQYIFRDGSIAAFAPRTAEAAGHYLTDDPAKIKELEEISVGHAHIYIDPAEHEVEKHLADPAIAIREEIATEARSQLASALQNPELLKSVGIDPNAMKKLLDSGKDFGNYSQGQLQPANSDTVGQAMADSNGGAVGVSE